VLCFADPMSAHRKSVSVEDAVGRRATSSEYERMGSGRGGDDGGTRGDTGRRNVEDGGAYEPHIKVSVTGRRCFVSFRFFLGPKASCGLHKEKRFHLW